MKVVLQEREYELLTMSKSITDWNFLGDNEALDSNVASGITKIINEDFFRKEIGRRVKGFLTCRQLAGMTHGYYKVSDVGVSVLDPNEVLKVELKNDNVQSCNNKYDETVISMRKPNDEILENLHCKQHQQPDHLKTLCLCASVSQVGPFFLHGGLVCEMSFVRRHRQ